MWQIRARQAEDKLLQLTAGDNVTEEHEPATATNAVESPQTNDPAPTGVLAWWRRLWSG